MFKFEVAAMCNFDSASKNPNSAFLFKISKILLCAQIPLSACFYRIKVVLAKSSLLLLNIILQNTKTVLQLFAFNLKQKLFTKDIKNAKQLGFERTWILTIKGVERKGLELRRGLLIKIRECFMRANICN